MAWSFEQELIKAALTAGVSLLTLGLGWLIGVRITAMWTLRQKRRELEFSAANELYRLYGEFFAVWKLWNYLKLGVIVPDNKDARWELMKRAALVDAGFEALLVKVTSERVLTATETINAGLLRQGFQQLRQSIKTDNMLDWSNSEHPQYSEFKRLACFFANIFSADHDFKRPEPEEVAMTLKEATSNKHESNWKNLLTTTKSNSKF
jgi:hypothetical protein